MIIIVTGTPGTGKTTLSKKLSAILNFNYVDVNDIIDKYSLSEGFDEESNSKIIDVEKLSDKLKMIIKSSTENLIIDSHLSHYIDSSFIDLCIVAKCELKALKQRLESRGYSEAKVRENLDSEIFDICFVEASENNHNIIIFDTSKDNIIECVKKIKECKKDKRI